MLKIINSQPDFEAFRETWDNFYTQCPEATPFQSFAYNFASWKNLREKGDRLHIICIYRQKDKQLLALFPTYLDKKGCLRFINGRDTDFSGALFYKGFANDYHLLEEFTDYVKNTKEISALCFDNLKADNPLTSIFSYLLRGTQIKATNAWSILPIPGKNEEDKTFIDCLSNLNSKDKYRLKNIVKKMKDLEFKLFHVSSEPYPTAIVEQIVNDMFAAKIRVEAYFSTEFLNLIKACYDAGELTLAVTYQDEKAVCINFYYQNQQEFIDWLAIYTDKNMNLCNIIQMMQHIYENGGGQLNFARGLYPYKVHNFRPTLHNLYSVHYSKTKWGQFKNWLSVCKYYLKVVVKPYVRP